MQAHGTTGYNHVLAGRPATALPHLERCLALYDPTAHRRLALVYGEDPGVSSHQWSAYATWLLGYPDRARRHATEARRLAQDLGYPNDISQATWFATVIHIMCRDVHRARQLSDALLRVCAGVRADPVVGPREPRRRLDDRPERATRRPRSHRCERAWRTTPAPRGFPTSPRRSWPRPSPWPATRRARSRPHPARSSWPGGPGNSGTRQSSPASVARSCSSSHPHRRSAWTTSATDAERALVEALDIARRQQAKSLELRAATSLARLGQSQARHSGPVPPRRHVPVVHRGARPATSRPRPRCSPSSGLSLCVRRHAPGVSTRTVREAGRAHNRWQGRQRSKSRRRREERHHGDDHQCSCP